MFHMSAAMHLGCGGMIASLHVYCRVRRWKNFENRSTFGEVVDKSRVKWLFYERIKTMLSPDVSQWQSSINTSLLSAPRPRSTVAPVLRSACACPDVWMSVCGWVDWRQTRDKQPLPVVDRGVGDWGSCPGHQGRGHQRGESKNNANLHDEKRDWFYHFK